MPVEHGLPSSIEIAQNLAAARRGEGRLPILPVHHPAALSGPSKPAWGPARSRGSAAVVLPGVTGAGHRILQLAQLQASTSRGAPTCTSAAYRLGSQAKRQRPLVSAGASRRTSRSSAAAAYCARHRRRHHDVGRGHGTQPEQCTERKEENDVSHSVGLHIDPVPTIRPTGPE